MSRTFNARRLDVVAFAQAGATLSATDPLQVYKRLAQEGRGPDRDLTVKWQATGERRKAADGALHPALHLQAEAHLCQTCQRCLGEVLTPVAVDRHFVFVNDEDAAAALDEESEDDDVLVAARDFDLHTLIEDELLMALPLVPRHDSCPTEVPVSAQSADFDTAQQERRQPFAALAALKRGAQGGESTD